MDRRHRSARAPKSQARAPGVSPVHYRAAMEPAPVAPNEQLPEPLEACELLCRACRNGLSLRRPANLQHIADEVRSTWRR